MKYLLDTHALLWWWLDDVRLSPRAKALIADEKHEILISAASAWEIATKFRLGKLVLAQQILPRYHELLRADGFTPLTISHTHALHAASLEHPHRDPFDRLLAAQSRLEAAPLISCDAVFAGFALECLW